jgi:hypothetical protein
MRTNLGCIIQLYLLPASFAQGYGLVFFGFFFFLEKKKTTNNNNVIKEDSTTMDDKTAPNSLPAGDC